MTDSEAARDAAREMAATVRGKVEVGASIGRFTTFRVGGPAAVLVEPAVEEDLAEIGRVASEFGMPVLPIGRGSNLLVADSGFQGIVVRMGRAFEWIKPVRDLIQAGAATPLPQIANWSARRGLTGAEFMVAIPGSIGGGVRMNAGAHGSDMAAVLDSVRVFHLDYLHFSELSAARLELGYRRSNLRDADLVCWATLRLSEQNPEEISRRIEDFRAHRAATQPLEAFNAGSMFKNPGDASAGKLIERAGLKGHRVGAAEVSDKHANFFIARPGSTAQNVYELMADVQRVVRESEGGVVLIPEVRLVGDFGAGSSSRLLHSSLPPAEKQ